MNPADEILEMLETELPRLINQIKKDQERYCPDCELQEQCAELVGYTQEWCLINKSKVKK